MYCRKLTNTLLQWMPSNVGITGNEGADDLTKKGTKLHEATHMPSLITARSL